MQFKNRMDSATTPSSEWAIGLVLYYPDERLLGRIDRIVKLGYRLYVFDNSPYDAMDKSILFRSRQSLYLTAGKNMGLGYSLSTLCATAYAHGFQRLLFLDQDTAISDDTLQYINRFSMDMSSAEKEVYIAVVFSGKKAASGGIVDTSLAISSGSLFALETLKKVGWHNEKYFVDCVDYELCLRARRHGYKVGVVYNTPGFDHVSEQPDRKVVFLGKELLVRRYSAARIWDALKGYFRLLSSSVAHLRFFDVGIVIRSLAIYLIGQLISRVIPGK